MDIGTDGSELCGAASWAVVVHGGSAHACGVPGEDQSACRAEVEAILYALSRSSWRSVHGGGLELPASWFEALVQRLLVSAVAGFRVMAPVTSQTFRRARACLGGRAAQRVPERSVLKAVAGIAQLSEGDYLEVHGYL